MKWQSSSGSSIQRMYGQSGVNSGITVETSSNMMNTRSNQNNGDIFNGGCGRNVNRNNVNTEEEEEVMINDKVIDTDAKIEKLIISTAIYFYIQKIINAFNAVDLRTLGKTMVSM